MNLVPAELVLAGVSPPGGAGGNAILTQLVFFAAIFAIFYFLLIRPQQNQRKANPKLIPAAEYTPHTFAHAVRVAAEKAHVPHWFTSAEDAESPRVLLLRAGGRMTGDAAIEASMIGQESMRGVVEEIGCWYDEE